MENMENNIPEEENLEPLTEEAPAEAPVDEMPAEEPAAAPEPVEDTTYRYVPARKTSPYADSPYVMEPEIRQPPKERKRRAAAKTGGRGFWKTAVCAVLILALVGGACGITGYLVNSGWEKRAAQMESDFQKQIEALERKIGSINPGVSVSGSPLASGDGLTPAQVYAKNVDSVVMINNKVTTMGQTGTSTGSGFILTEDGYVVTNHHVVEGDGRLSVTLTNGEVYAATLVGSDNTNDVALLKIEAQGLQAVTVGSSDALIVGDQVAAIGNPLGELTSTLTVGYVSAK